MHDLDPALLTLLAARRGVIVRLLFWISARNRSTGAAETIGFCSDIEPLVVTIDGTPRTYLAAGGLLRSAPVVSEAGLSVIMHSVSLSSVWPEVDQALRGYDPRLAPVELHRLVLDPATLAAVGPPVLIFAGQVDGAPIRTPEKGGSVGIELRLASASRDLTRGLALKKSDEGQRRRGGDRFGRWRDVSGEVPVFWGSERHMPVTVTPATTPGGGPRQPPEGSGFQG